MLKNVKYLFTTHDLAKMPQDDLPEVVVVGRSNVGKSTFINAVTNNSKLAYVSSKPGKTRAVSFFDVDGKFRLVDVPGYGYAKVSKSQRDLFARMIEPFFRKRENIEMVILLLDIRNILNDDDKDMIEYLMQHQIPFQILGAKMDKTNQSERVKFEREILRVLQLNPLMFSSTTKKNLDKVVDLIQSPYL